MSKSNNSVLEIVESCWIGTELARKLGLNSRFFSRFSNRMPKSLNKDIEIQATAGLILVRIPSDVSIILRANEHVIAKIEPGDDTKFDLVLEITADTKIGFWK